MLLVAVICPIASVVPSGSMTTGAARGALPVLGQARGRRRRSGTAACRSRRRRRRVRHDVDGAACAGSPVDPRRSRTKGVASTRRSMVGRVMPSRLVPRALDATACSISRASGPTCRPPATRGDVEGRGHPQHPVAGDGNDDAERSQQEHQRRMPCAWRSARRRTTKASSTLDMTCMRARFVAAGRSPATQQRGLTPLLRQLVRQRHGADHLHLVVQLDAEPLARPPARLDHQRDHVRARWRRPVFSMKLACIGEIRAPPAV